MILLKAHRMTFYVCVVALPVGLAWRALPVSHFPSLQTPAFSTAQMVAQPRPSEQMSRREVNALATLGPLLSALAMLGTPSSAHAQASNNLAVATFSAGDPRLLEPDFADIGYLGVKKSEVGSIDGTPAIRVTYNADQLSYKRIVGQFLRSCDPTSLKQFGSEVPPIIWTSNADEQASAEAAIQRLQGSTTYTSETSPEGLFKGRPLVAVARSMSGEWMRSAENDQSWYTKDAKGYEKVMQSSGRKTWLKDSYKPVAVSACKKDTTESRDQCGFVYFPCNEENGCLPVINGKF